MVATRMILLVQAEQQKKAAAEPAEQASPGHDIDLFADRHAGQYALRKLYHASPRTMVVFYSSPTCGPCRSLKPVFGRILDEFSGKVSSASQSMPSARDSAVQRSWGEGGAASSQALVL